MNASRLSWLVCLAWAAADPSIAQDQCHSVIECSDHMLDVAEAMAERLTALENRLEATEQELGNLRSARPKVRVGARTSASPVRPEGDQWSVNGTCSQEETLIGYFCQVDSGSGLIQNFGSPGPGGFYCLWASTSADFSGHGFPVCMAN